MKIGIVTTWFERGAAYVSRAYMDNLRAEGHEVFIYARGGEQRKIKDPKWNGDYVTWGYSLEGSNINDSHFFKWIESNHLEAILFNEQTIYRTVALTKKRYPNVKLAAYIDYYTETSLPYFNIYDFVICNTKRHLQAMDGHPQAYYLKWGTDVDLFSPQKREEHSKVVFFHSAGMSTRKGTDVLVDAFIDGKLYGKSELVIHSQIPVNRVCRYTKDELSQFGIRVIEETVTAPGLYYLGDVYVYPTRLDGLGLTMYEALACGLPVITTDYPPMNEVIDESVGRLVKVERNYAREDAYYWPMSVCDKNSLINCMEDYIFNQEILEEQQRNAREKALSEFDWKKHSKELSDIFEKAIIRKVDNNLFDVITKVKFGRKIKDKLLQYERIVKWKRALRG